MTMGGGSWRGAYQVSKQCGGPGYSNTSRGNWMDNRFSSRRPRGTSRSRACSVVPLLVHWQVRFSATMGPARMYGRICGLNAVKVAVSHHGRCSR